MSLLLSCAFALTSYFSIAGATWGRAPWDSRRAASDGSGRLPEARYGAGSNGSARRPAASCGLLRQRMEAAGEVRPHTARRGLQRERTMVGAVAAGLASGGSTAAVPALVAFFIF